MIDAIEFLGNLVPLLGIISITLIIATEMSSIPHGRIALKFNRKNLKASAVATGLFCLITIIAKALDVILH
jgi:hypothetical protein